MIKLIRAGAAALIVALTILGDAAQASAQTQPWAGPDLTRRPAILGHAIDNFDIAISEVCFPYLLQHAEESSWQEPHRTGIVPYRDAAGAFDTYSTYFVGPRVLVGVRDNAGARSCQASARDGDDDALHAALMRRLAQLPVALTPAVTQIPAGTYAHREFLCGPATGDQYAALIDYGPRNNGDRGPHLIVTLWVGAPRDARCDGAH